VSGIEEARKVIEFVTPRLQAEGYSVYLQPSRGLLPAFMRGYEPDAIAIRVKDAGGAKKNLAIEVKVEGYPTNANLEGLTKLFAGSPDWELRVYYARPAGELEDLPKMGRETIDTALDSVRSLIALEQPQAALMLGWASIEALGRSLAPERLGRAQGSLGLIEVLANEGLVTPTEADTLRGLASLRDRLIHGALDQHVSPEDLRNLVDILDVLSGLVNSPA
jgi:uncharacterized protein YutE (UPF0331/DUF86 family)